MKYVIDAKLSGEYDVIVCGAGTAGVVAGRAVSATRLASGTLRVTVCCMEMGEAAGIASALCARHGISPDQVDISKLRQILLDNGAIL